MAHFTVFGCPRSAGCHASCGLAYVSSILPSRRTLHLLQITLASDILLWTIDWYVVGAEEFQQYMLGEIGASMVNGKFFGWF
jgi:hypothetical protein